VIFTSLAIVLLCYLYQSDYPQNRSIFIKQL